MMILPAVTAARGKERNRFLFFYEEETKKGIVGLDKLCNKTLYRPPSVKAIY